MIENTDDLNVKAKEDTTSGEENTERSKKSSPFGLLFDILFTGTAGWKRLRRSRWTPEQTAAGCFYPILALVAICRFADWFYVPDFNLSATLIKAASIFVAFFLSYFSVQVICRLFFPFDAKSKTETPYFKLLVQYALSSLALFRIPAEVLPVVEPLAVFLPIWTIFIITKGVRFLRLPENNKNRCMVTMILATIAMPYIFIWLTDKIL